jgi:hypothetical protein
MGGNAGTDDKDKDGWTVGQGDCNDNDSNVNPGAVELLEVDSTGKPAAQQLDNDCDGKAQQPSEPTACDAGLGPVVNDPFDAARAMGLCQVKVDENSQKWGVISAAFSDISTGIGTPIKMTGKALEHAFGILPGFGVTSPPREGGRLFALSSGIARAPGQPGWGEADVCSYSKSYTSAFPPGFPKQGTCGNTGAPNDGVALDLKIRVPTNARSLKFNFRFFSCEYPSYTCSVYNDIFAVLMSPSPLASGDPMTDSSNILANIAFESSPEGAKNVIGVNNESFFSACEPGAVQGDYVNCKPGNGAQLEGSGFEKHGASSWLVNQTNVPPGGIIHLRFAIWDSADGILDSSAIVDAFRWSTETVNGATSYVEGAAGSGGSGGAGGSSFGGSNQGGNSGLFGGSGGVGGSGGAAGEGGSSGLFGGSAGNGGSSTAGSSAGGTGGAGGSSGGQACPDGSCAGPGECCLDPANSTCGSLLFGMLCN